MENTNLAERDFFFLREKMRKQNRVWKKIKEGKLKKLTAQLLWMYLYVRRYWLLIAFYVLLGASGSVLSLGFSLVTRDLVDAVTGMNTKGIGRVVALYVGVGVGQIFVNAVKTRISFQIRLKVTNEIRADIYEQVLHTDWASLAGYRSILLSGLIFLVVFGILVTFIPGLSGMESVYCLIGIGIFLGYTAYDTQRIREFYYYYSGYPDMMEKASIFSALQLYLDFINLFLYLLRFLGRQRD